VAVSELRGFVIISSQKQSVEWMLETMEQLKKSDKLQRVTSRYKRRAATFHAGELSRCELVSLYLTLNTVVVMRILRKGFGIPRHVLLISLIQRKQTLETT